ncbi:MAG: glycosyltransferase, partial [Burkholderiales bacterium]
MKAIFFTAGSDGDIHPHLAVARALRASGHEVVFLTTFEYIEQARALGLQAICILDGEEKRAFVEAAKRLGLFKRIRAHLDFLAAKVSDCCRLAAAQIDEQTVLISPTVLAGVARLLHDRFGTPYVSTLLTPADLMSMRDPPFYKSLQGVLKLPYGLRKLVFREVERWLIDPLCRRLLRDSAASLGRTLPDRMYSNWMHSPQRILGLFPEWLRKRPPDWPAQVTLSGFPLYGHHQAAKTLPEPLLRFLDTGAPPVAVTAGTATTQSGGFFEAAVQALQVHGLRGILISRLNEQLPPLPDGIVHESYLPLDALLPRVSAFVHHGGIGTAALALRAGVPQLMLPTFSNQYDNAQRVAALGCGVVLDQDRG